MLQLRKNIIINSNERAKQNDVLIKNSIPFKKIFLFLCFFSFITYGYCCAQNCFVKKGGGFAVVEPHLVTRVCFLYDHALNKPSESELKQTLPGDEGLDPDPLMAEYLRLIINKRYRSLTAGTPLFECGYNLEMLKRDFNFAKLNGAIFPEFHCRGILSTFVPVKVINDNTCWWMALELIDCGNIEEEYDFELRWKREPNVRW